MKLLWLTVDRSNRIAHHFDDFRKTVTELPEVEVVTLKKNLAGDQGQNMWQLSRNLISDRLIPPNIVLPYLAKNKDFDYIFCDSFFAYLHEDWRYFDIPSAIFIEDVHQEVPAYQIKVAKELGIQTIFHRFNFAFHKFHRGARFDFNCIWLPHSIRMDRFNDHLSKSVDVLHVGVHPQRFYPNRYHAVEALRDKPYFKYIERPKDIPGESREGKWPIDRDYDNLLQRSKIVVTGGSIFNVPVQKYVEIPAASSLLLSNWFPDLGLMGFRDGRNMVAYHKENLVEKVEGLLADEREIERISNNGYNLILLNHTSEIRARQFINFCCQLSGNSIIYKEISPCSFQVCFRPGSNRKDERNFQPKKEKQLTGRSDWKARIIEAANEG